MKHGCCEDAILFLDVIDRDGFERVFMNRLDALCEIAYCPWCGEMINKDPRCRVCPCCRQRGGHEDDCMVGEEEKKWNGKDVPW